MVPAAKLHSLERFAAIPPSDPDASIAHDYLHLFGLMLRGMIKSFGAPFDLFEIKAILLKDRPDFLHYLRALEAMLRRILLMLVAAATEPLPPVKARLRATANTADAAPEPAVKPLWPAGLCVHFSYVPPPLYRGEAQHYPRKVRGADLIYAPAHPLAARLEALIRIYADPQTAVRRLRRRLARAALKHQVCARMMAEPAGLAVEYPHLLSALMDMEADCLRATARACDTG